MTRLRHIYSPISWKNCFVLDEETHRPEYPVIEYTHRHIAGKVFAYPQRYATWFPKECVERVFTHSFKYLEDISRNSGKQSEDLEDYPSLLSIQSKSVNNSTCSEFDFRFVPSFISLKKEHSPQFSLLLTFRGSPECLFKSDLSALTYLEYFKGSKKPPFYFQSTIYVPNLKTLLIDDIDDREQQHVIDSLLDCCTSGKLQQIRCSITHRDLGVVPIFLRVIEKVSKLAELNDQDTTLNLKIILKDYFIPEPDSSRITAMVTSLSISSFLSDRYDNWVEDMFSLLDLPRLKSLGSIHYKNVLFTDASSGNFNLKNLSSLRISFLHIDYPTCLVFLNNFFLLKRLESFTVHGVVVRVPLNVERDMGLLVRSVLGLVEDSSDEQARVAKILGNTRHRRR